MWLAMCGERRGVRLKAAMWAFGVCAVLCTVGRGKGDGDGNGNMDAEAAAFAAAIDRARMHACMFLPTTSKL